MTEIPEGLLWVVEAGVATLTFDRPRRGNSLTFALADAARALLVSAADDDDVRVLLVTGSGEKAFCTGIDRSEIADPVSPLERKSQLFDHMQPFVRSLVELGKPTIAAINGDATGAGLDLALACDMRIMSTSAHVAETYVKLGLISGAGGAYFLPRLVGRAKAIELLLTGDSIDAHEAKAIGLVNTLADAGDVLDTAMTLAARIASNAPLSVAMLRRAVDQCAETDLRTSLELLSAQYAVLATTEDTAEAMAAMKDKRPPHFVGR